MADIIKLDKAGFQRDVLGAKQPVMVDFTATWCGPCKMLEPVVKDLAKLWEGKVKVFKLDVDDHSDLAMQYGVMGVPTLILFVNGQPAQRLTGYQPKDRIIAKFGPSI